MKRIILGAVVAGALLSPAQALAAPSDKGACHQAANDAFVAASSEGTRGDFMSDVIFGNEPNIENPAAPGGPSEQEPGTKAGRVVPSLAPGPDTVAGGRFTGGDLQALVKAACA